MSYRKVSLSTLKIKRGKMYEGRFDIFDLGSCRIGIMICFDWFFPESARILALKGADIICHPANLVLPYCQDAMITRSLENKIYIITANCTGCEERSGKKFSYTGRSQITAPDTRILYRAGAQNNEIGIVEIDVRITHNKRMNEHNNIFADRKPEYYQDLVKTNF